MKKIMHLFMAALLVAVAVSCTKGNDTGISLSIKGTTVLPPLMKSISIAGFNFAEAKMGIGKIEIKTEDELLDDNDMEFDFAGNYTVDLLTGTTTPAFSFLNLPTGTYNKFESKLEPVLAGGKSFSVKGTYTNIEGVVYNFEFSSSSELEFEFESDSGYVLSDGMAFDMLINVNLPMLFDEVNFGTGTVNDSNIIVINESTNGALYETILHNIDHIAEMKDEHESEHK